MIIYKYPLASEFAIQHISMPYGAIIISCGLDRDENVCVWARVNYPHCQESLMRRLLVLPTGMEFQADAAQSFEFIGTVSLDEGRIILHVFEVKP